MSSKEKQKSRYKKWYEANKEKARADKAANMRRYRKENPKKHKDQSRAAKAKLRDKIHQLYGDVCVRCGFSDKRALTLDHVLNNGSIERTTLGERGVYRRATNTYLPLEYQILCMNCQFIKRVEATAGRSHNVQRWQQQHSDI